MATTKKTTASKKATAKKPATKKVTPKPEAVVEVKEEDIVNPAVDEVVEDKTEAQETIVEEIQTHLHEQLSGEKEVTSEDLREETADDTIPYEGEGDVKELKGEVIDMRDASPEEVLQFYQDHKDEMTVVVDRKEPTPAEEPKEEEKAEEAPKEEEKPVVKERPMSYERTAARMRRYLFSKQYARR